MSESKKKWWELDLSSDEIEFFENLARHPSYAWRNVEKLAKELGWPVSKLISIAQVHVNSKLVLVKTNEKGEKNIAYWERVEVLPQKDAKKTWYIKASLKKIQK